MNFLSKVFLDFYSNDEYIGFIIMYIFLSFDVITFASINSGPTVLFSYRIDQKLHLDNISNK